MEVGQSPNWGCSAKEKKIRSPLNIHTDLREVSILHKIHRLRLGQESSIELCQVSIVTEF
jgi:hypothetical protein